MDRPVGESSTQVVTSDSFANGEAMDDGDFDAVIAGHICLDLIPQFSQRAWNADALFAPGKVVQIGPAAVATGGPVSNTGQAMHRLGMRVQLQGKVGDDLFGRFILDRLAEVGLDEGMVAIPGEATSYTLVVAPPTVDRIFFHCSGANDTFNADDVRYDLLDRVRLFHLGYPPLMQSLYDRGGEQLWILLQQVKARGAATSLDMSLPDPLAPSGKVDWISLLERNLPYVDYFLPSAEETLFMLDRPRFDELAGKVEGESLLDALETGLISALAERLLGMGSAVVGIKLGHRGFYLRTAGVRRLREIGRGHPSILSNWADRELWHPSFNVQVASATGSGDSAIAGFLSALLRGYTIEQTLEMACAVGACNVEALDAISGILSWDETKARIAGGWKMNPLVLDGSGWQVADGSQLRIGPADAG